MTYGKIMKQLKSFNFTDAQRKKLASIILKLDKEKQDILVSGDNIATINGQSLLNGGNISLIKTGIFTIVTELPTNDIDKDKVYLVPSTETDNENKFSEYIYTDNGWEKLGTFTAKIDLSNYVQKTDVVTSTTNGLISPSDKAKLDSLENYTLPAATTTTLGGVKISTNNVGGAAPNIIHIEKDGTIKATVRIEYSSSKKYIYLYDWEDDHHTLGYIDSAVIVKDGPKASITENGLMSKEDKAKLDSQPTIKASDATGVTDDDYVVIKKSELNSILSRLSALENKA